MTTEPDEPQTEPSGPQAEPSGDTPPAPVKKEPQVPRFLLPVYRDGSRCCG